VGVIYGLGLSNCRGLETILIVHGGHLPGVAVLQAPLRIGRGGRFSCLPRHEERYFSRRGGACRRIRPNRRLVNYFHEAL